MCVCFFAEAAGGYWCVVAFFVEVKEAVLCFVSPSFSVIQRSRLDHVKPCIPSNGTRYLSPCLPPVKCPFIKVLVMLSSVIWTKKMRDGFGTNPETRA